MKPAGYLQTADRALQVLSAFTADRPRWGVTELARALELDKSQVQRLLATLAYRGYLTSDDRTKQYRLGPALVGLGQLAERSDSVTAVVRPILARLARVTGHSAVFNVPDASSYRCAVAADGKQPIRYAAIVGQRFPGHGGASGHAIFAYRPEREVRVLAGEYLERFTGTTVTGLRQLLTRYAEVRDAGVAVSDGEYDERVTAVAAPVRAQGLVTGSVAVLGPREHLRDQLDAVVELVREAAAEATATITRPREDAADTHEAG